jgi:multidrug efflux pump
MSLATTSIRRPVLTWVLSAFILLLGAIGLSQLGTREYPAIDPPLITVTATYSGASAEVIENQVTEPLEQSLNGIDGIRSIVSKSSQGEVTIEVEFLLGTDLERAANDVRDRVSRAQRNLPADVESPVVSKADANADPILLLSVSSPTRDILDLSDQAERIQEKLQTVPGVAEVDLQGERKYAMRLDFNPEKMASLGVTLKDVQTALGLENAELPAGSIEGRTSSVSMLSRTGLRSVRDFRNMVVRASSGSIVRLADFATVRLGAENERTLLRSNGKAVIGLAVLPQPGANQISIADEVIARLAKLKKDIPADISVQAAFDNTRFVRTALSEVRETLAIAFLLVVGVIFLFLRDWRTTLIPVLAMPISLVGVFFLIWILGYSINVLTLLGVVLAIGLVVDDAIVVLENIYAKVEKGLTPMDAAKDGLEEIFAAVVSTTLVLAAVFTPMLFLSGFTGRLFREFGVVIGGSVLISGFVALTLSGMLSSRLLRERSHPTRFYAATEPFFVGLSDGYQRLLLSFLSRRKLALAVLVAALATIALCWRVLPRELAPLEDRSSIQVQVTGHEGATYAYMDGWMRRFDAALRRDVPELENLLVLTSNDISSLNTGTATLTLKPVDERKRSQDEIAAEVQRIADSIDGASALVIQEPSIRSTTRTELPLQFVIQASSLDSLRAYLEGFVAAARADSTFSQVDVDLKFSKPQLDLTVDRDRVRDLGVSPLDLAQTLQLALSEDNWGYFQKGDRQYEIIGALDSAHRGEPSSLQLLSLRSSSGKLLPVSSLFRSAERPVPPSLPRYDRWASATVSADMAPGHTLGEGVERMRTLSATRLSPSFRTTLSGSARDLEESSGSIVQIFLLSLLIVYLILAAQFESFRDPLVTLLTVPLALAGALFSLVLFGFSLNIFSEIGLVMLVGLVTKNGILIVEFANQRREAGLSPFEAVVDAASARLRPILMTTLCTVLGTLPIALALGAGSQGHKPMGVAVIGGLLVSLCLTLFVVPAIYVLMASHHDHSSEVTE